MEAVRYVRTHASRFKVSPGRIGFMGFSAGGFTAVGGRAKLAAFYSGAPGSADYATLNPHLWAYWSSQSGKK
jgi:dienelactone hydrolase